MEGRRVGVSERFWKPTSCTLMHVPHADDCGTGVAMTQSATPRKGVIVCEVSGGGLAACSAPGRNLRLIPNHLNEINDASAVVQLPGPRPARNPPEPSPEPVEAGGCPDRNIFRKHQFNSKKNPI